MVNHCLKCSQLPKELYIGETGRTIGSRIKEHLSMDKQTVLKHIMSHKRKQDKQNHEGITWRVIHKNIGYHGERKCIDNRNSKTLREDNEWLYWESD
jgi:hypothetical protein